MKHFIPPQEARGLVKARAETAMTPVAAVEAVNKAFDAFKAELDTKLKEEIKAGVADVITTDKIGKIEASISDAMDVIETQNEKLAALQIGQPGPDGPSKEEQAYAGHYETYMRTGDETQVKAAIKAGDIRAAASVGTDADGGYTSPVEWDRTITDKLAEVSQMRSYASVQTVTGQGFKKLYNLHGASSGWVGETDARPETNTPTLGEYTFAFGEIYANPAAYQRILDDSEIDIAAWLGEEVRLEFAQQEGTAFLTGDGVNKPKGFLNYDAATEGGLPAAQQHPLGPIGEVNTGAAAALTVDGLIDLVYDLPDERMAGAEFFMNKSTAAVVRKFKDADNNLIWNPPVSAGEPSTLLGFSIRRLSNMPNVAASAIPIAFGNMMETYRIFDRFGVRVLRDPYTAKPKVLFYTTKRVGGGLWNPEWMRYHRVAA
ncbi:phage major capsid protein [Ruegeria jejuensis]|uniref:phage major capsid protein n=1 Tax=Ruegeria jejuensis TaxID=3233338 RepID=UPI00355BF62E